MPRNRESLLLGHSLLGLESRISPSKPLLGALGARWAVFILFFVNQVFARPVPIRAMA